MSVLEKALKLELLGMKGRGRSAYAIIKSEFSIKGNRQSVYDQFKAIVADAREEKHFQPLCKEYEMEHEI
jgi:hypothetical protein